MGLAAAKAGRLVFQVVIGRRLLLGRYSSPCSGTSGPAGLVGHLTEGMHPLHIGLPLSSPFHTSTPGRPGVPLFLVLLLLHLLLILGWTEPLPFVLSCSCRGEKGVVVVFAMWCAANYYTQALC